MDGPAFPAAIKAGAAAARNYLAELGNNKTLDWTFFSPAIEMHPGIDTGRTGHYRLGTESPVFNAQGRSVLPGEDLAIAVLDEVEKYQYGRQRFTATYYKLIINCIKDRCWLLASILFYVQPASGKCLLLPGALGKVMGLRLLAVKTFSTWAK